MIETIAWLNVAIYSALILGGFLTNRKSTMSTGDFMLIITILAFPIILGASVLIGN